MTHARTSHDNERSLQRACAVAKFVNRAADGGQPGVGSRLFRKLTPITAVP
jgi:hypothetical protein